MASEDVNNIKAEVSLVGSGLKMTIRREKPVVESLPSCTEWISETRGNGLGKLVLKRKNGSVTASPSSGVISSSCSPGTKKTSPSERNIIRLSFINSPEDGSQIAQIKQLSSSSCDVAGDEGVSELSPACHLQPSPKDSGIDVSSPPHDDGHVVSYGQIVTVNGCDTEQNITGALDRLAVDRATSADVCTDSLPVCDSESLYYSDTSELKSWEPLSKVQSTLRTKAERTAINLPAANGCRERRIFKSRQNCANGPVPAEPVYRSTVYTVSSAADSDRKRRFAPDESSTYNLPPKKPGEKVVERVILKIKQGSVVTPSASAKSKEVQPKKCRTSSKNGIKLTVAKVSKISADETDTRTDNVTENVTENIESNVNRCRNRCPRLTAKIPLAEMKKSVASADSVNGVEKVSRKQKIKESKMSQNCSGVGRKVLSADPLPLPLPSPSQNEIVDSNASSVHNGNRTSECGNVKLVDPAQKCVAAEQSSRCSTSSTVKLSRIEQSVAVEAFKSRQVSPTAVDREIVASEGSPPYSYECSAALQHCDPGGSQVYSEVKESADYNSFGSSLLVCSEMEMTSHPIHKVPLNASSEQRRPAVDSDIVESHSGSNNSANGVVTGQLVKGHAEADGKTAVKEHPDDIRQVNKNPASQSAIEVPYDRLPTDFTAGKVPESKNCLLSPDQIDSRTKKAMLRHKVKKNSKKLAHVFQQSVSTVWSENSVIESSKNVPSAVALDKSTSFSRICSEAAKESAVQLSDEVSQLPVDCSAKLVDVSNDERLAGSCEISEKDSSHDAECFPTRLPLLSLNGSWILGLEDQKVNSNKVDCECDVATSVTPASDVISCLKTDQTKVDSMHSKVGHTDHLLTVDTKTAALSSTVDSVESLAVAGDSLLLFKTSQPEVVGTSTLCGPLLIESPVDIEENLIVSNQVQTKLSLPLSVASTKSLSPALSVSSNAGKGGFMTEFAKFVTTSVDVKQDLDDQSDVDDKTNDANSLWMIDLDNQSVTEIHSVNMSVSEVTNCSTLSSEQKLKSVRSRKTQRTAVNKTGYRRSHLSLCSRKNGNRSVSLTKLNVNSFMPDHCRLVDLRCKTCDMLRAVFPSLEYPVGFCRESKSVDELLEQILQILNQPASKTTGVNKSEPCSEPFVDICSLPEQCMNRLRRQIVRLISALLPGIDISDIDDIEGIEVLLEMITSANEVKSQNPAGTTAETLATKLSSLPGTWPVSVIPVQKLDKSLHCSDVKMEGSGILPSSFSYSSIAQNPSINKRTIKRQVKDCLMFLDKDLT